MGIFIKIINDGTGDEKIGNYKFQVNVNDKVLDSGKIEGFERVLGWEELVKTMVCVSQRQRWVESVIAFFDAGGKDEPER
jgi:hypothetical protein